MRKVIRIKRIVNITGKKVLGVWFLAFRGFNIEVQL
jgi:hypothetical protein